MTADVFRRIALSFSEAIEASHMGHPDFRVAGKIFATLGPDEDWGMVKLTPQQQQSFMQAAPNAFKPATGAWGQRGATIVTLRSAKKSLVKEAMNLAWHNTAPPSLLRGNGQKTPKSPSRKIRKCP
jgi:hypothetical protein